MPVRKPQEAVRKGIASEFAELRRDLRMERIVEIEDDGLTGIEVIGEQHAARGRLIFAVMRADADLAGRH